MSTVDKHELMIRGARSRLVDLNKERLALLKMFKELDVQEELVERRVRQELPEPPLGASGRRLVRGGSAHRTWAALEKGRRVTPDDVAGLTGVPRKQANQSLNQLVAQKLVRRVKRGVFQLR